MSLLSDDEIALRLQALPGWRREDGAIIRDVQLADFNAAIALVNAVAELAEARNHHPDILVHGWNSVRLTLSTHSQGGITAADLDLAELLDGLA